MMNITGTQAIYLYCRGQRGISIQKDGLHIIPNSIQKIKQIVDEISSTLSQMTYSLIPTILPKKTQKQILGWKSSSNGFQKMALYYFEFEEIANQLRKKYFYEEAMLNFCQLKRQFHKNYGAGPFFIVFHSNKDNITNIKATLDKYAKQAINTSSSLSSCEKSIYSNIKIKTLLLIHREIDLSSWFLSSIQLEAQQVILKTDSISQLNKLRTIRNQCVIVRLAKGQEAADIIPTIADSAGWKQFKLRSKLTTLYTNRQLLYEAGVISEVHKKGGFSQLGNEFRKIYQTLPEGAFLFCEKEQQNDCVAYLEKYFAGIKSKQIQQRKQLNLQMKTNKPKKLFELDVSRNQILFPNILDLSISAIQEPEYFFQKFKVSKRVYQYSLNKRSQKEIQSIQNQFKTIIKFKTQNTTSSQTNRQFFIATFLKRCQKEQFQNYLQQFQRGVMENFTPNIPQQSHLSEKNESKTVVAGQTKTVRPSVQVQPDSLILESCYDDTQDQQEIEKHLSEKHYASFDNVLALSQQSQKTLIQIPRIGAIDYNIDIYQHICKHILSISFNIEDNKIKITGGLSRIRALVRFIDKQNRQAEKAIPQQDQGKRLIQLEQEQVSILSQINKIHIKEFCRIEDLRAVKKWESRVLFQVLKSFRVNIQTVFVSQNLLQNQIILQKKYRNSPLKTVSQVSKSSFNSNKELFQCKAIIYPGLIDQGFATLSNSNISFYDRGLILPTHILKLADYD